MPQQAPGRPRKRQIRRSQTLSPFGVGAVYDVRGESFVACQIDYWHHRGERITSVRLGKLLGKDHFRMAPAIPDNPWATTTGPGIPFYRFPRWLFCSNCNAMTYWSSGLEKEAAGGVPKCPNCLRRPQLVPMRFVAICKGGHLDDVDWRWWAHTKARERRQIECRSKRLEFDTRRGMGGGLESLIVRCLDCRASRSLQGIASPHAMKEVGVRCRGRQPWQKPTTTTKCEHVPQVVQRGASNVHFSEIRSALDIPPHSRFDPYAELPNRIAQDALFPGVVEMGPGNPLVDHFLKKMRLELDAPEDVVLKTLANAWQGTSMVEVTTEDVTTASDLRVGEWNAFLSPIPEDDHRNTFVTQHVPMKAGGGSGEFDGLVSRVVIARKLREVRAFTGFSRLEPSQNLVAPDMGKDLDWLPGLEVFGEGIFIALCEDAVAAWEVREDVRRRMSAVRERVQGAFWVDKDDFEVSARYVLTHTLAHLLIRQLTFECGYSSASLRERLYVATGDYPMAGILIYTAAGDSEGTMGGLARQGEPPRLVNTLGAALSSARWCSSDPICGESAGQGNLASNLAACHACSLVAETSCERFNSLLDRGLVVGTLQEDVGFFTEALESGV